jgi:hypothetical protein
MNATRPQRVSSGDLETVHRDVCGGLLSFHQKTGHHRVSQS